MEGLFTAANRATERTLVANDYALVAAPDQHCCGALHAHAGDLETARSLARRNIARVRDEPAREYVVTNAAGCGALMKEYGHLLADDGEWAARAAGVLRARARRERAARRRGPARGRAARRIASRTMRRAISCTRSASPRAPLAVLDAIPGLERVRARRLRPVLRQRRHLQPARARALGRGARAQARAHRASPARRSSPLEIRDA